MGVFGKQVTYCFLSAPLLLSARLLWSRYSTSSDFEDVEDNFHCHFVTGCVSTGQLRGQGLSAKLTFWKIRSLEAWKQDLGPWLMATPAIRMYFEIILFLVEAVRNFQTPIQDRFLSRRKLWIFESQCLIYLMGHTMCFINSYPIFIPLSVSVHKSFGNPYEKSIG